MKYTFIIKPGLWWGKGCCVLALFLLLPLIAVAAPEAPSPLPTPSAATPKQEAIAKVGSSLITSQEYQSFSELRIRQLKQQYGEGFHVDRGIKARLLEEMIDQKLLLIKAQSTSIEVPEKEVDEDIASILASLPPRMTMETLLQQQQTSLEEFRSNIHDKLLVNKYVESISADLVVKESEIVALYAQQANIGQTTRRGPATDFQLILCAIKPEDPNSVPIANGRIKEAQDRIDKGEDFGEVALALSDEPNVEEQKGLYREGLADILPPEINKALAPLAIGEVSAPFQSPYGMNIVKVLARHEADTEIPYETMRDTLEKMLYIQLQQKLILEKVDSLRHIIHIEIFPAPKSEK